MCGGRRFHEGTCSASSGRALLDAGGNARFQRRNTPPPIGFLAGVILRLRGCGRPAWRSAKARGLRQAHLTQSRPAPPCQGPIGKRPRGGVSWRHPINESHDGRYARKPRRTASTDAWTHRRSRSFRGSSVVKEEAEAAAAGGMAPLPGPAAPPRLLLLPAASTAPAAAPGAPSPSPPPRKRQRLAHLSPEEKALRRKLKNRVAAQSARDRKKARMGELERQAVELETENQRLLAENRRLRERAHSLARENHDLRLRLGLPALKVRVGRPRGPTGPPASLTKDPSPQVETQEETASTAPEGAETGSSESAALRLRVPPQKGQAQQSSASPVGERRRTKGASSWAQTAWLLQMLSLISSWAFWTVWTQTCSCTAAATPRQPSLRSCSRKCVEKQLFPYLPPPAPPWGLHHSSKTPLMN